MLRYQAITNDALILYDFPVDKQCKTPQKIEFNLSLRCCSVPFPAHFFTAGKFDFLPFYA